MPQTRRAESATKVTASDTSVAKVAPAGRKKKIPAKDSTATASTATDPAATKPTAVAPTITGNDEPNVLVPPPKKAATRSRKRASAGDDLAEPSNTGDLNAAPTLETQLPPKKRTKVNQPPPSRDPLPNRARNNHPGAIDAPRPKRSSAEVQAAKKELEAIEARKREDEARKLQLVAELELEDEAAQEAEIRNVVKSVGQVQESEGPEEFTFSEVDEEESEEDEDEDNGKRKAVDQKAPAREVSPSRAFPKFV